MESNKVATKARAVRVMNMVWWVSAVWLALAAVLAIGELVWWFTHADDPMRYESAIASAIILVNSSPAGLGVLVAAVTPRTGLSPLKRVSGVALAVLCIGILMLHDYLQAKYR